MLKAKLRNLKVDPESKRTNCLKRLQPLESLPADGGCIADSDVGPQRREDGGGRYMGHAWHWHHGLK